MKKQHEHEAKIDEDNTKEEKHTNVNSTKVTDKKEDELQKIREDILKISQNKNKIVIQWNSLVVTGVLVLLSLVAVVQTVQSAAVLEKINSGNIKSSGGAASAPAIPSSLEDLPDMVGGC